LTLIILLYQYCICRGDGSCKHIAALLFGLTALCSELQDRSEVSSTDVAAWWVNPRKSTRPRLANEVDIRKEPIGDRQPRPDENTYKPVVQPGDFNIEKEIFRLLKRTQTNAVALYVLSDSEDSDSSVDLEPFPMNVCDLATEFKQLHPTLHVDHSAEQFTEFLASKIDTDIVESISDCTIGQGNNEQWGYQRLGRITASTFYNVCHFRSGTCNYDNYIVKSVMGKYSGITSVPLQYGHDTEPVARQLYIDQINNLHEHFTVRECGLHVNVQYPYLGASPDGLVACSCCGEGLLEIKCAYTHRHDTPQDAAKTLRSFSQVDGSTTLKADIDSPFYVQIQGQLAITGRKWCDFVFHTTKGIYYQRVVSDRQFWENYILPKLHKFYMKYIVPKLIG
jgi:hypothetical protein